MCGVGDFFVLNRNLHMGYHMKCMSRTINLAAVDQAKHRKRLEVCKRQILARQVGSRLLLKAACMRQSVMAYACVAVQTPCRKLTVDPLKLQRTADACLHICSSRPQRPVHARLPTLYKDSYEGQ